MRAHSKNAPSLTGRFVLPATRAQLAWFRRSFALLLQHPAMKIPSRAHWNILLALHELLTNAVTHAEGATIAVEWRIGVRSVRCGVRNRGAPIAPHCWRGLLPAAAATAGRGIFLVRQLADRVTYRRLRGDNLVQAEWAW